MEEFILFIHHPGVEAPVEIKIAVTATAADLLAHPDISPLIGEAEEIFVFVEEEEVPLPRHAHLGGSGVRHGSRVHIGRHREVEVKVFFVHLSADRRFPPGTRVRRVKDWAAEHFGMAGNDAIEHVLQLHGTSEVPSPATPLAALIQKRHHEVAFDLVPSKRVEG